jgi:hypothetical protein
MYSWSLEVSKPWIVWRYGMGIFAFVVWVGGWFLSDENRLPNPKDYMPVEDRDVDDIIEEEIEEEEDNLWHVGADGTVDLEAAFPRAKETVGHTRGNRSQDDLEGSSDDEMVRGVSNHLLRSDQ